MTDARGELLALAKDAIELANEFDRQLWEAEGRPGRRVMQPDLADLYRRFRAAPVPQCDAESATPEQRALATEFAELIRLANDSRVSSETIGMRVRHSTRLYAALVSPPSEAGREET
jgi:hypothetical protein